MRADSVAGKGNLIFYNPYLIHCPSESICFKQKRSILSVSQSESGVHQSIVKSVRKECNNDLQCNERGSRTFILGRKSLKIQNPGHPITGTNLRACRPSKYAFASPKTLDSVS